LFPFLALYYNSHEKLSQPIDLSISDSRMPIGR